MKMSLSAKSSWLRAVAIAVALALLLVLVLVGVAEAMNPVRLCGLCTGYTISTRGDDTLIRCPGLRDPWLTLKNCTKPVATRRNDSVTITCNWLT